MDVDKQKMCFQLVEFDRVSILYAIAKNRYPSTSLSRLNTFLEFIGPEFIRVLQDHST